jgi:hypothetical protein
VQPLPAAVAVALAVAGVAAASHLCDITVCISGASTQVLKQHDQHSTRQANNHPTACIYALEHANGNNGSLCTAFATHPKEYFGNDLE